MYEEEFTSVFVKSLGGTLTDEYLKTCFGKYYIGIKDAKVAKDRYGKPLDFGYVTFYRRKDAEAAMRNIDEKELIGTVLEDDSFKESEVRDENSNRNVFVKGFGDTLNKKELRVYFRDHVGDVESAEVALDRNGFSRGYGYVCFYKREDAVKAIRKIHGRTINGRKLSVEFFIPREERISKPVSNVYVKGFQEILDDEDLKNLFEIFGEVSSAKVERNINGTSKRYGYVCFKQWIDAEIAIKCMDGFEMGSNILTVQQFRYKEERQKDLKNRNLHIKNLHESINEEELGKIFQPYGKVLSSVITSCPIEGVNQGYVCFEKVEEADNAIAALNHYLYKGLRLQVCVHHIKESRLEKTDNNFASSHRQSRECPELLRIPCVPNAKENLYKFKSLGNLSRKSNNLPIAANFSVDQSYKKSGRSTYLACSDEKHSEEKDIKPMVVQDLNRSANKIFQSRKVKTSHLKTKENANIPENVVTDVNQSANAICQSYKVATFHPKTKGETNILEKAIKGLNRSANAIRQSHEVETSHLKTEEKVKYSEKGSWENCE